MSCPLGYKNACRVCPYCKESLCDYPYDGIEKQLSISGELAFKLLMEDLEIEQESVRSGEGERDEATT